MIGAGADALLGAVAFERELVGLDRDDLGLDRFLGGIIAREGGAGRLDDGALGADDLLQHLPLLRLRLANAGRGKAALEDRNAGAEADRGLRARVREAGRRVAREVRRHKSAPSLRVERRKPARLAQRRTS